MSEDTIQEEVDPTLVKQISGLIEFRKSKLRRLESTYVMGRSKVEAMSSEIKDATQNAIDRKQSVNDQIESLTGSYMGGGHTPADMQKWFAKEKYLKNSVINVMADIKHQEATLRKLKKENQEDKKAYQQAMIGVEKMKILKQELLSGTA